jgi:hypothetical protein
MNLNQYKNKRNKFTYDGNRIILRGSKELYPFVYKRIWDLTQYDRDVLESYGLNKAIYVYIGSSNKYNLNTRSSKWKYEILNNTKSVSKDIKAFIGKLKVFYELETSYTAKQIDYLLYYNASIIARCESLQSARKLEKSFTTKYHNIDFYGEILEQHTILLSKVDSQLKDIKDGTITVLSDRKKIS